MKKMHELLQTENEMLTLAEVQGSWTVLELTEEKYPNMTGLFSFTYLCKKAFSHLKILKYKYCSTKTDDHLEACMKLVTNSYFLDYETLADSI